MKLRHIAKPALIAFWLIMLPPISNGTANLKAPLKQWKLTLHVFDSASECEESRHELVTLGLGDLTQELEKKMLRNPLSPGIQAGVKASFEGSACVSSDDPRLNTH